jgi:hypothetical protein
VPGVGLQFGPMHLVHDISTDCFGGRSFYDLGGIIYIPNRQESACDPLGVTDRISKKHFFGPRRPFSSTRAPVRVVAAAVVSPPLVTPHAWIQQRGVYRRLCSSLQPPVSPRTIHPIAISNYNTSILLPAPSTFWHCTATSQRALGRTAHAYASTHASHTCHSRLQRSY